MNTKIIIALATAIAVSCGTFATETKFDSTKVRKNELGLNIAPLAVALMGGSSYYPRYALTYKRWFTEKRAIRIGVSYNEQVGDYPLGGLPYKTLQLTDSTRRDYYSYYQANEKYQLNLGYQFIFGKRKLKQFAGIDLILGLYHSHYYSYAETIEFDTTGVGQSNAGLYETLLYSTDLGTTNYDTKFIGLSPFYGIMFPVSKRFSVSAQVGYDFTYGITTATKSIYSAGQPQSYTYNVFEINSPGIVNDVSLIYRF